MPRFRMRIRSLLVLVALVAVTIGTIQTGQRWQTYHRLEQDYAERQHESTLTIASCEAEARLYRERASSFGMTGGHSFETTESPMFYLRLADMRTEQAAYSRLHEAWYAELREKYRRAARSPWWSVPPDAPLRRPRKW